MPNQIQMLEVSKARSIAREILATYSKTNGSEITQSDCALLIAEAYKNISAPLSTSDLSTYFKVLDRTGSGKIKTKQLEQIAIKYLCGEDKLVGYKPYRSAAEELLDKARKLFAKHDLQNCGVLIDDEMQTLWAELKPALGLKQMPVNQPRGDVITVEAFEEMVAKQLQKSGVQVYDYN